MRAALRARPRLGDRAHIPEVAHAPEEVALLFGGIEPCERRGRRVRDDELVEAGGRHFAVGTANRQGHAGRVADGCLDLATRSHIAEIGRHSLP